MKLNVYCVQTIFEVPKKFYFLIYAFPSHGVVTGGGISNTFKLQPMHLLSLVSFGQMSIWSPILTSAVMSLDPRDTAINTGFSALTFKFFFFFNLCFHCLFLFSLFIRLYYLIVFKSLTWSGSSFSWVSFLKWSVGSWGLDGKLKTSKEPLLLQQSS